MAAAVSTAMAATVAAAAQAWDMTRLELLVHFVILLFYFTTLIFVLGPLNMSKRHSSNGSSSINSNSSNGGSSSRVPAAQAQDVTRLEPLVHFFILFFYFTTLMFILGPLNASKWHASSSCRVPAAQAQATCLKPLVCFFILFFSFTILMFVLGPLNVSKQQCQQRQQHQVHLTHRNSNDSSSSSHIGPLHYADCFHSWDWHNVPSSSDSWDPKNPGIPSASGWDIYLADEDRCLGRGRQVFWLARLANQQRVVASLVTQVGRLGKDTVLASNGSVTLCTFCATLYL